MLLLFNSQSFIKLLLIITVAAATGFYCTCEVLFSLQLKYYFLPQVICRLWYSSLIIILMFSSLLLFLTFFFLSFLLPVVSFTSALGINAVKSWLSRMQGRVGSLSVLSYAVLSRVFYFIFAFSCTCTYSSIWAVIFIFYMLVSVNQTNSKLSQPKHY